MDGLPLLQALWRLCGVCLGHVSLSVLDLRGVPLRPSERHRLDEQTKYTRLQFKLDLPKRDPMRRDAPGAEANGDPACETTLPVVVEAPGLGGGGEQVGDATATGGEASGGAGCGEGRESSDIGGKADGGRGGVEGAGGVEASVGTATGDGPSGCRAAAHLHLDDASLSGSDSWSENGDRWLDRLALLELF